MMKKIVIFLLTALLVFSAILPTLAQTADPAGYQGIVDEADLLTSAEEQKLAAAVAGAKQEYNIDVIVVTADYLWPGLTIEGVADAAFSQYAQSPDGAVFAIAMDTREWTMQGYGRVRTAFSEDVLDQLESDCIYLLSDGDYALSFESFITFAGQAVGLYDAGTPYEEPIPWGFLVILSLGAGFVVALIVVLIMKAQLKSVAPKREARDYVKPGSLDLKINRDLYLYHTVTRVAKPKQNTSSGSRSSGGGGGRSGRF